MFLDLQHIAEGEVAVAEALPKIQKVINKSKLLKRQIEAAISKMFNRPVNLTGEVNSI